MSPKSLSVGVCRPGCLCVIMPAESSIVAMNKVRTSSINGNTNGDKTRRKPSIKDFSDDAPQVYTENEKALIESGQAVLKLIVKQQHEQINNSRI